MLGRGVLDMEGTVHHCVDSFSHTLEIHILHPWSKHILMQLITFAYHICNLVLLRSSFDTPYVIFYAKAVTEDGVLISKVSFVVYLNTSEYSFLRYLCDNVSGYKELYRPWSVKENKCSLLVFEPVLSAHLIITFTPLNQFFDKMVFLMCKVISHAVLLEG